MSGTYYEEPDPFGQCACPDGGYFIADFEHCQHCGGTVAKRDKPALESLVREFLLAERGADEAREKRQAAEAAEAKADAALASARVGLARYMHSKGNEQRMLIRVGDVNLFVERLNVDSVVVHPLRTAATLVERNAEAANG